MKVTITHYEYTHSVDLPDDVNCDKFRESMTNLIQAVWGTDYMYVEYDDNYARLRESIDQLTEGDE